MPTGGTRAAQMSIYGEFARLYARGEYPQFSARVAGFLPAIFRRFRFRPKDILDLACGEGTFAVAMAKQGFRVTGVDQSEEMLQLAGERAERAGVAVRFLCQDMRSLAFRETFDLVTCWYDSLNYLLRVQDVQRTFAGIASALRDHGLFVFDMNNAYALSVVWQRSPSHVPQDTAETFEVHRPRYDRRTGIATLRITGFIRTGNAWTRVDEVHRERAYSVPQIRRCLRRAGLRDLACWGSIRTMTPPRRGDRRVWFVAQR